MERRKGMAYSPNIKVVIIAVATSDGVEASQEALPESAFEPLSES
jgi:hypothetical protein